MLSKIFFLMFLWRSTEFFIGLGCRKIRDKRDISILKFLICMEKKTIEINSIQGTV